MKYLILGINGMLGHVLFDQASNYGEVKGTSRKSDSSNKNIYKNIDAADLSAIDKILSEYRPDVVINCIGIIKQLDQSKQSMASIKINALFPHELSLLTKRYGAKLIHFSTDCVFKGDKGNYLDSDISDATDLYGRTKFLGEVGHENCLTLRTSIIGHELNSNLSLVDWFLSQPRHCRGYKYAIYTGFPTITLAKILFETIIPKMMNSNLHGVFNFSSNPISKYNLLKLISKIYKKDIEIEADVNFKLDRSLNSDKLRNILGFEPESWETMVQQMHDYFLKTSYQNFKKEYSLESI